MKAEPSWGKRFNGVSEEAIRFTKALLDKRPERRMTVEQALTHPWLTQDCPNKREARRAASDLKRFGLFASLH